MTHSPETHGHSHEKKPESHAKHPEHHAKLHSHTPEKLSGLREKIVTGAGTAYDIAEAGVKTTANVSKKAFDSTVQSGRTLTFREWEFMRDPKNHTSTKIFHGLGIMAAGYGLYRASKWALTKPKGSFLGKLFRFTGVAALATLGVNWLGGSFDKKKDAKSSYEESPAEAAAASTKPASPAPVPPGGDPFADDTTK